jgi:hypothetical protein
MGITMKQIVTIGKASQLTQGLTGMKTETSPCGGYIRPFPHR